MPMGMKNSSATMQRCMEAILHGVNWISCLIYLDDIVVFARTFQEHADRVDMVLSWIEAAGLKLMLDLIVSVPDHCLSFYFET